MSALAKAQKELYLVKPHVDFINRNVPAAEKLRVYLGRKVVYFDSWLEPPLKPTSMPDIKRAINLKDDPGISGQWDDYNKILPEDPYMEEMSEGARVWQVYNKESERFDSEMIKGWKDTLDNLLIFAGLFLGVVATFVTQSSQSLQQDYTQVAASLLTELVGIQRAAATGGNISSVAPSTLDVNSIFSPGHGVVLLNGLWLISLAITLYAALVAGFIKQWIHFYLADRSGSPLRKASIRQFRFIGLTKWFVPLIIEALPTLLHIALLLFSVGLIIFSHLLTGTGAITWAIGVLTCVAFVTYVIANSGPFLSPQCPYKASLTGVSIIIFELCLFCAKRILNGLKLLSPRFKRRSEGYEALDFVEGFKSHFLALTKRSNITAAEDKSIERQQEALKMAIISDLATQSSNPYVSSIALQSLAALHSHEHSEIVIPPGFKIWDHLKQGFRDCFHHDTITDQTKILSPQDCERFARAILLECLYEAESGKLVKLSGDDHRGSFGFGDVRDKINFEDLSEEFNLIHHLCASKHLKNDVQSTALILFMANHGVIRSKEDAEAAMRVILKQLSSPSEMTALHGWVLSQLNAAIESSEWRPHDTSITDEFCLDLICTLSTTRYPPFREEMKIRYLYSELHGVGRDDHLPGQESKPALSECLLHLLPRLSSSALSKGPTEVNKLIRFLGDFLPHANRLEEHPQYMCLEFWPSEEGSVFSDITLVDYGVVASELSPSRDSFDSWQSTRISLLDKLKDLIGQLTNHLSVAYLSSVVNDVTDGKENKQLMESGVDAVLCLADICLVPDKSVILEEENPLADDTILWLLELCYHLEPNMMTESIQQRLRHFFYAFDDTPHGSLALKAFFNIIMPGHHLGLPNAITQAVLPNIDEHSWRQEYWSPWSDQFDRLFRSFYPHSSGQDASSQEEQARRWTTLAILIYYDSFTPRSVDTKARRQKRRDMWYQLLQSQSPSTLEHQENVPGESVEPNGLDLSDPNQNLQAAPYGWAADPWEDSLCGALGPESESWRTDTFTTENFESALRGFLVFSYNFDNMPGTASIVGDDADLRFYLSASRYLETCLNQSGTRVKALEACCKLLPKEAPPGLPVNLSEEILDALWESQGEDKSRKAIQISRDIFKCILNQDPREANFQAPYSIAFRDRQRTLTDLVSFACYMATQSDHLQRQRWKGLISDWDKLLGSKLNKLKSSDRSSDQKAEEVMLKGLLALLDDANETGKRLLWRYSKRETSENVATNDSNTNALDNLLYNYRRDAVEISNRIIRGFAELTRQSTSDSRSSTRSHEFEV